jgi:hypothetical protein
MNLTKNENQVGSFARRLHVFTNVISRSTLTYGGEYIERSCSIVTRQVY